jgi:hypothetical protein
MSEINTYIGEWSLKDLVDPRGSVLVTDDVVGTTEIDAWPIEWSRRKVGLFSNRKPNADAMLDEVKRGLLAAAPDLSFVYGCKEPLAEGADASVIESLRECDVVVLASAECGGCTSWVCRDYITLEKLDVPCLLIATNRFESLARAVLASGGIKSPHLAVPKHPVSGITADQAQGKIRELMGHITAEVLGSDFAGTVRHRETV